MSSCLHPIYIKVDRRPNREFHMRYASDDILSARTRYRDVRPTLIDYVPVPCGKCINCLKNRQNALVSRALEESEKRGTFIFLTLTYADEYLPIAQSLWRSSKVTGECELVDKGEVISSARDSLFLDRAKVLSLVASDKPRYYDSYIDGFEDDEYVYFSRLTPSVCRKDVRLWLKRCRVNYERERGCKLSPFTYVCVSEYGPNTCRPHYHLAFFGLSSEEVSWLAADWKYGFVCQRTVNRVNPDGTDGFSIAARYIGKYMTKGKFDCQSVIDKCSEKPRICQSMHIGQSLIDKIRPSMLCFDMYGSYDIDTLYCPSLGRCFNDDEVKALCKEIPNRLKYQVDVKHSLPIPRLFREKVFYHEHFRKQKCLRFTDNGSQESERKVVVKTPSTIWLMASSYIRDVFSKNSEREFRQCIDGKSQGEIFDACASFANYQACLSAIDECVAEKNYTEFLCRSVF